MSVITGTGTGLAQSLQTAYEKMALDNLEASLYFQQLCKHESIPANTGKTYSTYRYSKIASSTGTLTEATVPNAVGLSATTTSVALSQYGQWVLISDLGIATHRTTVIPDAIKELSYTGAKSIDEVVRTELAASATDYFANGNSALSTVGADDSLDAADIRKIVANFKTNNVRPFDEQNYIGLLHPYQMYDLRSDTDGGNFLDINKYTVNGPMLKGEIGAMWQMRLLETSQITSTTTGTSGNATVYSGFALGSNAIMDVDLSSMPFELFVKPVGSAGADDPLNQKASVGYKFTYGAKYIGGDGTRAYKVQSAATYNG